MMQSVQLIVERLKNNPEDFFGDLSAVNKLGMPRPKFYEITDKIDNLLTQPQDGQIHRLWYLEPDEKEALLAAYKEARRARFEAQTFYILLSKQEREEDTGSITFKTQGRYALQTGLQGTVAQELGAAVSKCEGSPV